MAKSNERKRVIVAGGGIAGLEATLALHHYAGELIDLVMLTPEPEFTYRPLSVEEPFSLRPAERLELAPVIEELGFTLKRDALARVDTDAREVQTQSGEKLGYDALIVCVGGRAEPAYEGVVTFMGANGPDVDIDSMLRRAAEQSTALVIAIPSATSWPLPGYELALLARRRSEDLDLADVPITLITPEEHPLGLFGTSASAAVDELLTSRRIEFHGPARIAQDEDGLRLIPEGELDRSVILSLPAVYGPDIEGLPADEHGFIPIDEHAAVPGAPGVYAAGDGTAFPVKHGGIATEQADAAAEHIAASFGADLDPQPFHPVLRGQLIAGRESLHMRQDLTGGAGEGVVSLDYLWWPPAKVTGRFLAPFLGHAEPGGDIDLPVDSMDVEIPLHQQWHGKLLAPERGPMRLD